MDLRPPEAFLTAARFRNFTSPKGNGVSLHRLREAEGYQGSWPVHQSRKIASSKASSSPSRKSPPARCPVAILYILVTTSLIGLGSSFANCKVTVQSYPRKTARHGCPANYAPKQRTGFSIGSTFVIFYREETPTVSVGVNGDLARRDSADYACWT